MSCPVRSSAGGGRLARAGRSLARGRAGAWPGGGRLARAGGRLARAGGRLARASRRIAEVRAARRAVPAARMVPPRPRSGGRQAPERAGESRDSCVGTRHRGESRRIWAPGARSSHQRDHRESPSVGRGAGRLMDGSREPTAHASLRAIEIIQRDRDHPARSPPDGSSPGRSGPGPTGRVRSPLGRRREANRRALPVRH